MFLHPASDVQSENIGVDTRVWQYTIILPGAAVGNACNICSHCFIENDVIIGNNVTIKSGVQIWDGLRIADDVFIGPNASFSNDKYPRSKQHQDQVITTHIGRGASIGAGAVILPGVKVGEQAMISAGAVVTRSVPPYAIAKGNPARITGYITTGGTDSQSVLWVDSNFPQSVGVTPLGVGSVTAHRLKKVADMRGELSVAEFSQEIPFIPKRYFLVFNVPSKETRGEHAHYTCHQFLVCVKGSCHVVADDGHKRAEIILDSPDKGIHLPPMVWGIQYKYSADAVLLVFASEPYMAEDYIRDYQYFIERAHKTRHIHS